MTAFRLFLKRRLVEASAYASSLNYGRTDRIDFILFSGGRRGTHLLIDLINSHGSIHCDSELLHPGRVRPAMYSLPRFLGGHRRRCSQPVYGFKTSLHQLCAQTDAARFLHQFCADGGRVIHLRRENYLRAAVSSMIAHQRKRYHDHDDHPLAGQTFQLNAQEVVRRVRRRLETDEAEKKLLKAVPHLQLSYERDLLTPGSHQQTADRIFTLLNLDHKRVRTTLRKTSPSDLSALVKNIDEVRTHLVENGLQNLLEEEPSESREGRGRAA